MSFEQADGAAQLRARALDRFNSEASRHVVPRSPVHAHRLLQELQIHQIELEMQNEALSQFQTKLEADLILYADLYDRAPAGLFKLDKKGMVTQVNLTGARLLGCERSGLAGQRLAAFVVDADVPRVNSVIEQVFAGERTQAIDVGLLTPPLPQRTVQLEVSLSPDGQGCCVALADVTARRQLEQARGHAMALELEQRGAEVVSQAKSAFMSSMSHELRTPLNAVLGFAQLLKIDQQHALDELQCRRLQAVLAAGEHLLKLVDDVLDLAQLEAGTVRLGSAPVDIKHVLDNALCLIAPAMADSGLTLTVEHLCPPGGEHAVLLGDKGRLVQVLLNLLTNAIKYNVPGGRVQIIVDTMQMHTPAQILRIAVVDTGRGMNEAQLARAFESFNRLGQERGDIPGIGVGLAITRWLVELMGGTLTAHSELGKGSRFEVRLPTGKRPLANRAASNDPFAKKGLCASSSS